jgi:hypothetical protein
MEISFMEILNKMLLRDKVHSTKMMVMLFRELGETTFL